MDFQWSLKEPERDNESKEGDVPRPQLQPPDPNCGPTEVRNKTKRFLKGPRNLLKFFGSLTLVLSKRKSMKLKKPFVG